MKSDSPTIHFPNIANADWRTQMNIVSMIAALAVLSNVNCSSIDRAMEHADKAYIEKMIIGKRISISRDVENGSEVFTHFRSDGTVLRKFDRLSVTGSYRIEDGKICITIANSSDCLNIEKSRDGMLYSSKGASKFQKMIVIN